MRQLSGHDASFLDADTLHANANVTFVQIYDQSTVPGGVLRFKTILSHIQGRLHRSPIFRSRLLRVPLELDEPYWVEDEDFDLEYHVRHIALPRPGDWRQFCIQASRIHARALDLNRPLWEIYVIEGLDSITELPPGSFALLTKIHHAAIDVESRNEFVEVLHDSTRRPARPEPAEPWFPERPPGPVSLLRRAALHCLTSPGRLLRPLRRAAPVTLAFARDLLHPERHLTATRFNAVVSPHRVFDTRRFLVEEFEAIRGLVEGASLDDAVLAVCAGGLRRYLAAHAELPRAELSANVPLANGPTQGHAAAGRIGIGTDLDDPLRRLERIHAQTAAARRPWPEASQPQPLPCCTITHVTAPGATAYLHGARMTYFSAILPISDGMGLVFAVSRYDGRIIVSPTSCRELMPDPQFFTQCLRDSFQEVLALARAAPAVRRSGARGSASGTARPSARTARSGAKPPPAAPAGRRRSTAPRR
jgi:WS/DGAT/MGAT family acyltransferase